MKTLPDPLTIAIWITGTSWMLAVLAYLLGGSAEWILPLFSLGALTGLAEWLMRQKAD